MPAQLRRRLESHRLQSVHEIITVDPSVAIKGVDVPIHIVSCYSDRSRILCEHWRDGVVLLHNSYLTSFLQHLAAVVMVTADGGSEDLPPTKDILLSMGKKLLAEQMHVISPSGMARVLFLETVLKYEPAWREVVRLKDSQPRLSRSVDTFARLTSDFLLNHELGHTAAQDARFEPFTRSWVQAALADDQVPSLTATQRAWLRDEATADVFGLNCCLARYAPSLSAETLRSYLIFLARSVTAMNVLYAFAEDLHRANIDREFCVADIDFEMTAWAHRERVMIEYLESFPFHHETVIPRPQDDLASLPNIPDLFAPMLDTKSLVSPPSEDARLLAEIVSAGFEAGSFERVIEGVRAHRVLEAER